MTDSDFPFQHGDMLYSAILGAFRASGTTFDQWYKANGVTQAQARNVTFGISQGPKSRQVLKAMILGAGPDVVKAGYLARLTRHVEALKELGALK
ncbi:hypothetical protein ACFP4H_12840 [Pseudophaeobacter arcticus]|uniref:hypothetical protein n=1 Tax=Pseudophaeobacter arcticus TaxID=385492 RepID=UPI000482B37F|nr:hypothetical protein [Pseudophaeobacter arcticus]